MLRPLIGGSIGDAPRKGKGVDAPFVAMSIGTKIFLQSTKHHVDF
jgi:hypothetical protein